MHADCRINKRGFTLIEILVAAGILSLFMTGVFSIYRSSSRAFVSGSWRADEQKRLQTFLAALSRDLSLANPSLYQIMSDGARINAQATPIHINSLMFSLNAAPTFLKTNGKNWVCLLAFSISYPYVAANATLAAPETNGRWSGVSIWAKDRKIRYVRTGDPDVYNSVPAGLPGGIVDFPGPALVGPGLNFLPDPHQNRDYTYDLSLEEIAVVATGTSIDQLSGLEIISRSVRYEGGAATDASIQQTIGVRIASMSNIVTF